MSRLFFSGRTASIRSRVEMRCVVFGAATYLTVCLSSLVVEAEYRTWTAATGNFTTEAEFVGRKSDDFVALRRRDGTILNVRLSQLSAADVAYVAGMASVTPPVVPPLPAGAKLMDAAEADRALKSVEREAQACKTAQDAAALYAVFLSDPTLPSTARAAAATKAGEWNLQAAQKLVRLGTKWVPPDELRQVRAAAATLIAEGVDKIRSNQHEQSLEKLIEAGKTAPDDIQADFIIATVYAIQAKNFEKAAEHYKSCLRREPTNPAVLNNLALTLIRQNKPTEAFGHWRTAVGLSHDERIIQNIDRLFDTAGSRQIFIPPAMLDQLSNIYTTLVLDSQISVDSAGKGWQYMLLPQRDPLPATSVYQPSLAMRETKVAVCGAGVCIRPEYVLTTRSSIAGATQLTLADPSLPDAPLTAKVVASSDDYDLAILHCPGLQCPPLPLAGDDDRRGEELVVASYAPTDMRAAAAKLTRATLRCRSGKSMAGYESASRSSIVGGSPAVDSRGAVVALHRTSFEALNYRYGAGVDVKAARAFIDSALRNASVAPSSTPDLAWEEVEKRAAQATVVVLGARPVIDVGLTRGLSNDIFVDKSCPKCNAFKTVRCPARQCTLGRVGVIRREITGVNPATGQQVYLDRRVSVPCDNCRGQGRVPCTGCNGSGVDRSVQ